MKSKIRKILITVLSVVTFSCVVAGCAESPSTSSSVTPEISQGEDYEYTFDKPFSGTPDDYMTLDGKLDEDIWKDKYYVGNSVDDAEWQATTHFSDKGLYIGLRAVDDTMNYETRYNSRSAFNIYICKTGTQTYGINNEDYHESRCLLFECDPYYCKSKNRVPYYYKANVEGKLNSGKTCTMTAELFLTWEDLYYTENELGKKGYPDDIQMYINYEGDTNEVLGTCLWREDSYLHFDKDGYKTISKYRGDFGNEVYTSTDMWKKNADGNFYTSAGRSQIFWINASAKDFLFEVELKPLKKNIDGTTITFRGSAISNGRFGIISKAACADDSITATNKSVYTVYSANINSIVNRTSGQKEIKLRTNKRIDSFQWLGSVGLEEETAQSNYNADTLVMRVIKKGDTLYYFYGDTYWKSERISAMENETCCCGVFTNEGVEILDYTFVDYTDDETGLKNAFSEYVYFIETPETDNGSVSTSTEIVTKGQPVTITFAADSDGSVLTQVSVNGTDSYGEIVAAMNTNGEYTFIPTSDTTIDAEFGKFSADSLVRVTIALKYGNTFIDNSNCNVQAADNKAISYSLMPNKQGYCEVNVPKAGTYTVGDRQFTIDGTYTVTTSSVSGYLDAESTFTLNDQTTSTNVSGKLESVAQDGKYTHYIALEKNAWGSVKVNGVNVSGSGTLKYNKETCNYYATGSTSQYYTAMVGDTFDLKVKLTLSDIGHQNDSLSGIQITNGKYIIVLKTHLNYNRALYIATGSGYSSTSKEVALDNFGWTSSQDVVGAIKGSGVVEFRVIKSGDAIYIYNGKGSLMCYLNSNGINLVNSKLTAGTSGKLNDVNSYIKNFFAAGTEVVVGVRAYGTLKSEYDLNYNKTLSDEAKTKISYASVAIENGTGAMLKTNLKEGYAKGETVKFALAADSTIKNARLQVLLETGNGMRLLEGSYDSVNNYYVFSFVADGTAAKMRTNVLSDGDMGWSNDWLDYTPDKNNTTPEKGEVSTKIGKMKWYSGWGTFVATRENTTVEEE